MHLPFIRETSFYTDALHCVLCHWAIITERVSKTGQRVTHKYLSCFCSITARGSRRVFISSWRTPVQSAGSGALPFMQHLRCFAQDCAGKAKLSCAQCHIMLVLGEKGGMERKI